MQRITLFSKDALGGFYPIRAALYRLSQCFLFAIQSGGFQHFDIQMPAIQAEKSTRLKQIVESILAQRLEYDTIVKPVIADVLIDIGRPTA
jgi:hypothetical protein